MVVQEIDVICPTCGGYIYKFGITKSRCVRCERVFTLEEYEKLWKEVFEGNE